MVPRRQNVSIGITYNGVKIDLVPGRIQQGTYNYHSLYKRKISSWIQTNVNLQIETIIRYNRSREIRSLKIWRNLHKLDFPSFYLELTVIEALKGRSTMSLADNVLIALNYIKLHLSSARVEDPANSNNVISDDLSYSAKYAIANQAAVSLQQEYWGKIIW